MIHVQNMGREWAVLDGQHVEYRCLTRQHAEDIARMLEEIRGKN